MGKKKNKNSILDSKVFWALISLLLALGLWVYVTTNESTDYSAEFEGVLVEYTGEEELRQAKGYIVTEREINTVKVTLKGPRRIIASLKSEDIKATIDLSKVTNTGLYNLNYTLTFQNNVDKSQITTTKSSTQTIPFYVDSLVARTVELRGVLKGNVAEGYISDTMVFSPTSVRISGPESEVSQVAYALVEIDREDIDATINTAISYKLMDADGNQVEYENIILDQETVNVTLPINELKQVPLSVTVIPGGGATEENIKMTIDPEFIDISGDSEILKAINKIDLGNIDLSDFMSTAERTYPIIISDEVMNRTGVTEAKVTFEIVGLDNTTMTVSNFEPINTEQIIADGYKVEVSTRSLDVKVRGSAASIAKIASNNFRIVLDMTDYVGKTGKIDVPAKIQIDGFQDVGEIGDYSVIVVISEDTGDEE